MVSRHGRLVLLVFVCMNIAAFVVWYLGYIQNPLLRNCRSINEYGALGAIEQFQLFSPGSSPTFLSAYERNSGEMDSGYILNFSDTSGVDYILITDESFNQCSITMSLGAYLKLQKLSLRRFERLVYSAKLKSKGNNDYLAVKGGMFTWQNVTVALNNTSSASDEFNLITFVTMD